MKIAFLINNLGGGGAERVVSILSNKLIEEGNSVEIICLEKDIIAYDINERCKVTFLLNSSINNGILKLFYLFKLGYKLKKYTNKHKLDLIQSHLYRANYVNILSCFFSSKHICQIVNHSSISRYKKQGLLGKINLFLIKWLYPKANKIIAISKMMLNEIEYFANRKDIVVINNPYDIEEIREKSHDEVREFKFKENKRYIICVGRLIPLKRNLDIISVLQKLPDNTELILLGSGPEREKIMSLSKKLEVYNKVHLLGKVSNPYKYVAKADIFVNSSETEGFPNVLIEAMASGTFVISSDCISGPREILAPQTDYLKQLKNKDSFEKGEFGILFPVGNKVELQKAIEFVLSNTKYKNKIERKAFDEIWRYDIENIMKDYNKVI